MASPQRSPSQPPHRAHRHTGSLARRLGPALVAMSLLAGTQPGSLAAGATVSAVASEPVYYSGSISLPTIALDFSLRLRRADDGTPSGTIDIPMQAFRDGPLSDLTWTDTALSFTVALPGQPESVWPRFEFTLDADAQTHSGTLRQAGMEFPATIEPAEGPPKPPARPQTPVPPFPYEIRDITFESICPGVTIAGTLTLPEGEGPFPAVILITGSGPQDRDETLFDHKPFWVIADHLSRRGIAVLRCDDRGVGGTSVGGQTDPDSFDLATDVRAAIDFISHQPGIDPERIGLIGHSEGGLIAPIVAADDPRIRFIVMLAGTGVPGDQILIRQAAAIALAEGTDPEHVAAQTPIRERLFAAVRAGDRRVTRDTMAELLRLIAPDGMPDDLIESAIDEQVEVLFSRWMHTFLTYDPRETLRRITCPVLVMNGDLDLQVLHDQNVPEIAAAIRSNGNTGVVTAVLPGLNHLFQPATTGAVSEYATIEITFDPAALNLMTRWIQDHTRR